MWENLLAGFYFLLVSYNFERRLDRRDFESQVLHTIKKTFNRMDRSASFTERQELRGDQVTKRVVHLREATNRLHWQKRNLTGKTFVQSPSKYFLAAPSLPKAFLTAVSRLK